MVTTSTQAPDFKGNPILFYNVGVWGQLGFAVPNWGQRKTSANGVILELIEVIGRNLQAVMMHQDAMSRVPPSINTLIRIHKLVLRARKQLATEQVPPAVPNMEPAHAMPDKQAFKVFPTPYFVVRNRWMKTYCQLIFTALSEAMQHTENDKSFEISDNFAGLIGQFFVRVYRRMAIDLFNVDPATIAKDADGNPDWYSFTLSDAQLKSYNPPAWFTQTELIDTVSPLGNVPTAYDLIPLTEGIAIPELPPMGAWPVDVSDSTLTTAASANAPAAGAPGSASTFTAPPSP